MYKDILKNFFDENFASAMILNNSYDNIKKHKWNALQYLNELGNQISHIYKIYYPNSPFIEPNRGIDNIGDELADVLLQLIGLMDSLDIKPCELKGKISESSLINKNNLNDLVILYGQLSEVVMTHLDYRFKRIYGSYDTNLEYIIEEIYYMFVITVNMLKQYQLNLFDEFDKMSENANRFVKRKKMQLLKKKLRISNIKKLNQIKEIHTNKRKKLKKVNW